MKTKAQIVKVVSNEDPANAGRIKVILPQLDGGEFPEWIEPVFTPGWFSPPEPGETVEVEVPEGEDLIEFAHEIRYRGQTFDEAHIPPAAFKQRQKKVHIRGYFTKAGHLLIFNDKSGSEEVSIQEGKSGNSIGMTGLGQIYLKNDYAGSRIVLEPTGIITIAPGSPVNIDSEETNLNRNPTDYIVKGDRFNGDLETYLDAAEDNATANITNFQALEAAAVGPLAPLAASFGALKTSWTTYKSAIIAFKNVASGWLSTKTMTG